MKIDDPKIAKLKEKVKAAQQEVDMAVAFHELWKPTACDEDLHKRLRTSYATQGFLVVRNALRREMLLALMRLWDKSTRSIQIKSVRHELEDRSVIDALTLDRVTHIGILENYDEMRAT